MSNIKGEFRIKCQIRGTDIEKEVVPGDLGVAMSKFRRKGGVELGLDSFMH